MFQEQQLPPAFQAQKENYAAINEDVPHQTNLSPVRPGNDNTPVLQIAVSNEPDLSDALEKVHDAAQERLNTSRLSQVEEALLTQLAEG